MNNIITSLLLILLLSQTDLYSQVYKATVNLDSSRPIIKVENHKLYFGSFLEFRNDFINGSNGLWSQEIYDRGFDHIKENGFLHKWEKAINPENISLIKGGYNENGEYAVAFKSSNDNQIATIKQHLYVDLWKDNDFYIYIKNNSKEDCKFIILTKSSKDQALPAQDYHKVEIIVKPSKEWKKYSLTLPSFDCKGVADIIEIGLSGKGDIEIDECSLMPSDNVNGIRKEFHDLLKKWMPGIIRYPGGDFADTELAHFEYAIGYLDKRKSPLFTWDVHYQIMDFGVDEFMRFCKEYNAEPHIVVNLAKGTAEEAANYVEYCNGDVSSPYGKLRSDNGHPEKYNVKYWEIGNEQWSDTNWMVPRYITYHDAMDKKCKDLRYIIDGDLWQGENFLKACLGNTVGKCDNYGYHYAYFGMPNDANVKYNEVDRYRSNIGHPHVYKEMIDRVEEWMKKEIIIQK